MITRPLDLASRLRPAPRSLDWLFYVNVGYIVFFFVFFGSRFVLSPGLGIDFQLPQLAGPTEGHITTHVIKVVNAGQIFVEDGRRTMEQLQVWLSTEAKKEKHPALLVQASAEVPNAILTQIYGMAYAAGFSSVTLATEQSAPATVEAKGN